MEQDEREYKIGVRLFREGRILEAQSHLRAAATTGEDRPLEHFALGAALVQVGRAVEAREELQCFLRMAPNDHKRGAVARAAIAQLEERIAAQASEACESAAAPASAPGEPAVPDAQAEPASSPVKAALSAGLHAYAAGDYERAIGAFREAGRRLGPCSAIYHNLGRCHMAREEHDEAVACFDRALELEPGHSGVLVGKASALLEAGFRRATAALEAALEGDPDCFEAHMNLGSIHYMRGNIGRARTHWRKAHRIDPDDPQLLRNLRSI